MQRAQTEPRGKLAHRLDLFVDGVDEKPVGAGHDAEGNAGKSRARTKVEEARRAIERDALACQRQQGVDDMERDGLLRVDDAREVHDPVLLYDKEEMSHEEARLIVRAQDAKSSELLFDAGFQRPNINVDHKSS